MKRLSPLTALLVAACHYPPSGQVVARVDGQEITRRDLDTELAAAGGAAGRRAALDRLIRRRLLVAEAQRQGLDRTPDYLAAVRRNRDLILVGELARRRYPGLDPIDLRHRLETSADALAAGATIERQPGF